MLRVFQAGEQDFEAADALTWEYLQWAAGRLRDLHGIAYDVAAAHARDVAGRETYLPPDGRLLLASVGGATAGCVCIRPLEHGIGEIKRLYVRPAFRGMSVGRELVRRAVQEARDIGYARLRLDSGDFQEPAHALYRRAGFHDIPAYDGSEIPEAYREHWVFMELQLAG